MALGGDGVVDGKCLHEDAQYVLGALAAIKGMESYDTDAVQGHGNGDMVISVGLEGEVECLIVEGQGLTVPVASEVGVAQVVKEGDRFLGVKGADGRGRDSTVADALEHNIFSPGLIEIGQSVLVVFSPQMSNAEIVKYCDFDELAAICLAARYAVRLRKSVHSLIVVLFMMFLFFFFKGRAMDAFWYLFEGRYSKGTAIDAVAAIFRSQQCSVES